MYELFLFFSPFFFFLSHIIYRVCALLNSSRFCFCLNVLLTSRCVRAWFYWIHPIVFHHFYSFVFVCVFYFFVFFECVLINHYQNFLYLLCVCFSLLQHFFFSPDEIKKCYSTISKMSTVICNMKFSFPSELINKKKSVTFSQNLS